LVPVNSAELIIVTHSHLVIGVINVFIGWVEAGEFLILNKRTFILLLVIEAAIASMYKLSAGIMEESSPLSGECLQDQAKPRITINRRKTVFFIDSQRELRRFIIYP